MIYQLLKQLRKPLMVVAIGGASCLVVMVGLKHRQAPEDISQVEEDGPEELMHLLQLNEQLQDPASPQALEAIEASWLVAGPVAADPINARALCRRPPHDFRDCSLQQLVEFFNQAGVMLVTRVDDLLTLNFTLPELVALARACLGRWEYQRFKHCMFFITDLDTCSRAMLRIRQLMPPPSSRNAVRRSAAHLLYTLVIKSEDYVWDLPYPDRLFVNSGELEAELEAAVGVMNWEVDWQEWRTARRNPRALAQPEASGSISDVINLLRLGWGATED